MNQSPNSGWQLPCGHWLLVIGVYLVIGIWLLVFAPRPGFADETIDAIQHTYENLTDLQAQFTQRTVVAAVGKTVTNQGTLALKKPGRLRLEYQGTPRRQYISDGKRLWVTSPGDTQYQIFAIGGTTVPKEALSFLNGFGTLTKTFHVEHAPADEANPNQVSLILRPRRPAGYRQLDATFDARHLLTALTIHNPSGNTTHYRFSRIEVNPGLPDDLFRFTPPPGAKEVQVELK